MGVHFYFKIIFSFVLCLLLFTTPFSTGETSPDPLNANQSEKREGGYYQFRSNVEGARVYLNDTFIGTIAEGMVRVRVPTNPGPVRYDLKIEAPGYRPYYETILRAPKKDQSINIIGALTLLPANLSGTVRIAASPPGGVVNIDGNYSGIVDNSGILILDKVSPGYHQFLIRLNGYIDWTGGVYVEPNQVIWVRATLIPIRKGGINIGSEPGAASVLLNGSLVGITPLTLSDLDAGTRPLLLSRSGYQDLVSKVSIVAGRTTSFSAILTPIPTKIPNTPEITITPTMVVKIESKTPAPTPTEMPWSIFIISTGLSVAMYLIQGKKRINRSGK